MFKYGFSLSQLWNKLRSLMQYAFKFTFLILHTVMFLCKSVGINTDHNIGHNIDHNNDHNIIPNIPILPPILSLILTPIFTPIFTQIFTPILTTILTTVLSSVLELSSVWLHGQHLHALWLETHKFLVNASHS